MILMAGKAIGLLPSYASIGVGASVLLFVCGLVKGFSTGGEYGGGHDFSPPSTRRTSAADS